MVLFDLGLAAAGVVWGLVSLALLFLLPGYCLSKVFFPRGETSRIERIALSLGLSVTAVPATVLALNYLLNIKITAESVMASILLIVLPSIVIYIVELLVLKRMQELGGESERGSRALQSRGTQG